MEYGYARVSSRDQNLDRQMDALRAFPIPERRIFADRYTGATFDRPSYQALLRRLAPGDLLVVTSVDRLGRSYEEILEQWRNLAHRRRVDIVVLDMPLLDTRSTANTVNGVTGTFIADLVLQILSYVAQIERENTRQRQAEGIAAARARGKRFGRPAKERPESYADVVRALRGGKLTKGEAARELGVCRATLVKWLEQDGVESG